MSSGVDPSAAGLPIVNQASEPDWVRRGSTSTKKAYESALAFEEMLVEQLSQSLATTGGVDAEASQEGTGGSEEGSTPQSGAGTGELSSLLPQALTGGVMRAGGLGLAAQMTRELEGIASTQAAHPARGAAASGGTSAP
jgi:Rod binding domain-containing protein